MVDIQSLLSDPQNLSLAISIATKAANAALGTNISLPSSQVASMMKAANMALPYYKAKASHALNSIKKFKNFLGGGRTLSQNIQNRIRANQPSSDATDLSKKLNVTPDQEQEVKRLLRKNTPSTQSSNPSYSPSSGPEAGERIPKSNPNNASLAMQRTGLDTARQTESTTNTPESVTTVDQKQQSAFARRYQAVRQSLRRNKQQAQAEKKSGVTGSTKKGMGQTTFALTLFLAMIKDFIDFLSLGWLGTLINVVVVMVFIIVLLMSGGSLRKFAKKRKVILAASAVGEFLPFFDILPLWTLSIVWAQLESKGGPLSLQKFSGTAKSITNGISKRFNKTKSLL